MTTMKQFYEDRYGRIHAAALEKHPLATEQFLAVLNDPANSDALRSADRFGKPGLRAIVAPLCEQPAVRAVLETGQDGNPFRRAVGYGVKLRMQEFGWRTTGRKGSAGSPYFGVAEIYEPPGA